MVLLRTAQRLVALVLGGVLVFAGGAYGAAPAVSLKLADVLSSGDAGTATLNDFARLVAMDTNGEVQVTVFPNSQLANETTIVSALRSGTIDMGLASVEFWTQLIPGADALEWPYVVTSWEQASAIATNDAINSYYRSVFGQDGVVFVAAFPYTWKQLLSTKPVNGPEDLRGMKIRNAAGASTDFLQTYGANVVLLSNTELYQALLTHTVDGANLSISQTISLKFYEVAKYFTLYQQSMIWLPIFITQPQWQKLTKQQQDGIMQAGQQMIRDQVASAVKSETDQQQTLASNGVHIAVIHDFAPWKKVVAAEMTRKEAEYPVAHRLLTLARGLIATK
jgi:TRAP-type C4-dicarboxylate transport system substrate-binding protein